MRLALFSVLSVLALGLIRSEATNVVRIDPKSGLVCLILPPPGKLIGDTEQNGHVQCTDGKPKLLPSKFFGGQYDVHKDSGDNIAPGYPVFVELLEPDSGRWCIRFCHEKGPHCNMGRSSDGCEGALGITSWPSPSHH
ncbi:hypothetical protein BGZ54_001678 [Gamsiella multidivaricata]|nr:hypothetical protein BGZ54_001678 [Gamsiella multidivaricata]